MTKQQPIEIILLRQWASHMAMPVWIAGDKGELLFYNEPAEELLGRRFDEAGEMRLKDLPSIFHTSTPDGEPLGEDALPLAKALNERRPAHLIRRQTRNRVRLDLHVLACRRQVETDQIRATGDPHEGCGAAE